MSIISANYSHTVKYRSFRKVHTGRRFNSLNITNGLEKFALRHRNEKSKRVKGWANNDDHTEMTTFEPPTTPLDTKDFEQQTGKT